MKRLLMILAILLVFAVGASAQVPAKPFTVYVGGGLSMPVSPSAFDDLYKMGFHGSGGVGFTVSPMFQVIGRVEYHTWGLDKEKYGISDVEGGSFKVIAFGADGKFAFGVPGAPIKPFVLGGVGMANISVSDFEYEGETIATIPSETDFYVAFGGGVEFKNFFAQFRYVHIMTEGDATGTVPITVGVKF